MAHPARAAFVACLIAQAVPCLASPLTSNLEAAASRCFETAVASRCDAVWDLSAALKEQADRSDQLRCHTSVLAVEAMVAMAQQGGRDSNQERAALEALERDCP